MICRLVELNSNSNFCERKGEGWRYGVVELVTKSERSKRGRESGYGVVKLVSKSKISERRGERG